MTRCELEMACTGLEGSVSHWWAWEEFQSAAKVLCHVGAALLGSGPSAWSVCLCPAFLQTFCWWASPSVISVPLGSHIRVQVQGETSPAPRGEVDQRRKEERGRKEK